MNKTIKSSNSLMRKNFVWNMVGSTIYAFTSFIFLIIVTRVNGTDEAGTFTFAFSFSCMLYVIGIFSGRTFQVTESDKRLTQGAFIKFKGICCLIMIIIAIAFVLVKQYDAYKSLIIILLTSYKALDAFADSIYSSLQRYEKLYITGISLFLKSVVCTGGFFIVDIISRNLLYAVIALILIDVIIFLFYDCIQLKKLHISNSKLNFLTIKLLFLGGISVCLFFFLSQYGVNAQRYVIDTYLPNNDQAIYGILLMPATFVSVCAQFIINPFITRLKDYFLNDDFKSYIKLIINLTIWIFLIGLAAVICGATIGIPVLVFVFNVDLSQYCFHLILILIGSCFYAAIAVYSNALILMRHNWAQVLLQLFGALVAFSLSLVLVLNFELTGAAWAYLLSMFSLFVAYVFIFIVFLIKKKRSSLE